jgi:transcriptional regulator with PAS, ATPase and Fis domain
MESELFGYVKGALAGASTSKTGLIESADGGTAFFNGIDAVPLDLQAKLICVLRDREFHPVGSRSTRRSDFRVIAATNRDLAEEIEKGEFRRDLFYRLNVVNLRLAPLRERKEDIAALVKHSLVQLGGNHTVAKDAMEAMLSYNWPGNLRELEDCVRHAVAVSTGRFLHAGDLPADVQNSIGKRQIGKRQQGPLDSSGIERVNRQVPKSLWVHALKTFGSAPLATEWFLAECGALNNRAPIDAVRGEDGRQEVGRILGCIDYGMIA